MLHASRYFFSFCFSFCTGTNLGGASVEIALGIYIRDTDIDDAICSTMLPKIKNH
jgi:hypothetical protein